jgi:hypothetical protein
VSNAADGGTKAASTGKVTKASSAGSLLTRGNAASAGKAAEVGKEPHAYLRSKRVLRSAAVGTVPASSPAADAAATVAGETALLASLQAESDQGRASKRARVSAQRSPAKIR